MKQNPYDQNEFFQRYSSMQRSQKGLAGAGEWRVLQGLLPDFKDKRVLDLGCGYGWHCRYAVEQGAAEVTGIDISGRMLQEARQRTDTKKIQYRCMAIEDMDYPPGRFDIVLSSLALHYVEAYEMVCRKVYDCLASGGSFVFSVEHPIFTARGDQQWLEDEEGRKLHWPVDHYFIEGARQARFLDTKITKYHRSLTTYIDTLLCLGFHLDAVVEPQPPQEWLQEEMEMQDELRRPMMLILAASRL